MSGIEKDQSQGLSMRNRLSRVMLWAEKYRPKSLREVAGNTKAVQRLITWGEMWHSGKPERRALILSGGPGCGKTSAALALAQDMMWDVIELNASDFRDAGSIERIVGRASVNRGFVDGRYLSAESKRLKLLIFDEADNLFGKADYGGASAIVRVIERTCYPIILIVNEYYDVIRRSPKLKDLTEEVRFYSLRKETIIKRLNEICMAEKVRVDPSIIERIAESARGDMRAAINDLESVAEGQGGVPKDITIFTRDWVDEEFHATKMVLEAKTIKKAKEAFDNLDIEPEKFIFWLEENIPIVYRDPESVANAFESLSRAGVFFARVIRRQMYGLWAYAIPLMTGGVALAKKDSISPEGQRLQFPRLLRARKGGQRARQTLSMMLGRMTHQAWMHLRSEVLPYYLEIMANDENFARYLLTAATSEDEMEAVQEIIDEISEKKKRGKGDVNDLTQARGLPLG